MNLENRIARLEHRERIKELRAEYCYRIDDRDYDGYAALFTKDAHLDFGPIGEFDGQDAIRDFAENIVGAEHPFLVHMLHNPVISIDDQTASGQWYFEVPCTFTDSSAGWIQGKYNDEYAYKDGQWLFSSIISNFNYFAEYESGWADIVSDVKIN